MFGGVAVVFRSSRCSSTRHVRLRFPGLRWVINTPQWHHWHHSSHPEARDTNFGLPVIDTLFGTAYLPKGTYATEFGIADPVPPTGYVRHMMYPFTKAARASAT